MGLQAGGGDRRVLAALLRIEADKKSLSESEQSIADFLDSLDGMTDKLEDVDGKGLDASERMQDFRKQLIKLQQTIEEGSAEDLEQQFIQLDKALQNLTIEEKAFLGGTEKLMQGLKRAKAEGIEEFKTALEATVRDRAMQAFTEWTEEVETRADRMSAALSEFREIASQVKDTGQQIIDIARGFSEGYIERVGRTEEASRRWLEITDELQEAQDRLGRVATNSLSNVTERLLPLIDGVTTFLEAHPGIANSLVNVGGLMVAAGTAAFTISQLGEAIAASQRFIVMLQRINAMGGGGIGRGLGYAGATAGALALALPTGLAAGKGIAGGLGAVGAISQEQQQAIQSQTIKDIAKTILAANGALVGAIGDITFNLTSAGVDLVAVLAKIGVGLRRALAQVISDLTGGKADPLLKRLGLDSESLAKQEQRVSQLQDRLKGYIEDLRGAFGEDLVGALDQVNSFIDGIGKSTEELIADDHFGTFTEEILQAYDDFNKETKKITEEFQKSIRQQTEDFADSLVDGRKEFDYQLTKQDEEFAYQQGKNRETLNDSLLDLEQNFQDQQLEAAESMAERRADLESQYQEQATDRLKAYNKERERAEEDHRETLRDAVGRFDAITILNERRRYAKDQQRAESDFNEETESRQKEFDAAIEQEQEFYKDSRKEAQESLDKQRQDLIDNFNKQERDAQEAYDRQRKQQIEEYNRQEVLRREEFQKELTRQTQEHQETMTQRDREFAEQINQQQEFANRTAEEWGNYYDTLSKQLTNFLDQQERSKSGTTSLSSGGSSAHGFQAGGYAGNEVFRTHQYGDKPEFILSPRTTRSAEKLLGARLNQQNILAGLKGMGNKNMSIDKIVFNDVGSHSIPKLKKMIVDTMTEVFEGA